MKKSILRLVSLTIILVPWEMAFGYAHANRWGGSSAHTYGCKPVALTPLRAQSSSRSDVSPLIPTAPMTFRSSS